MRVNVYAEELTDEVDFVTKEVDGRRFYGIRLFLKSAPELHHTPTDDDRSAIVLWVPWTKKYGNDFDAIEKLQTALRHAVFDAQRDWQEFEASLPDRLIGPGE